MITIIANMLDVMCCVVYQYNFCMVLANCQDLLSLTESYF